MGNVVSTIFGDSRIGENKITAAQNRDNELILSRNLRILQKGLLVNQKNFNSLLRNEANLEGNVKLLFQKLSCSLQFSHLTNDIQLDQQLEYSKVLFFKSQVDNVINEGQRLLNQVLSKISGLTNTCQFLSTNNNQTTFLCNEKGNELQ